MLPILNIGPLAIQFPGLILLLSAWLGLSLAERYLPRLAERYSHLDTDQTGSPRLQGLLSASQLYNLVLGSLLAALIGARLMYIIQYTQVFLENPISIISLNPSLLDLKGALIGGLLFALYYGQKNKLGLCSTLDAITPALAIFAIGFHLANLASGSAFGSATQLPWAIELWGAGRHPVQLYEALAAIFILWFLWPAKPRPALHRPGEYFLWFACLSSLSRLIFEAFHGDSSLVFESFRIVQIASWLIMTLCLILLNKQAQQGSSSQAGR